MGSVFEAQGRGGQRIWVIPDKNIIVVMTGGGFEPADVGALVFPALKSDGRLPPNSRGDARLAAASSAAVKPPMPHLAEPLPSLLKSISKKVYLLNENGLGLKWLSLNFSGTLPTLSLGMVDGRSETRPIGFDGIPRISPSHNMRPPATSTLSIDGYGDSYVAVSGAWENDHTVVLDYDTIGNINDYQMRFVFRDRQLGIKLQERTGLIDETVQGHVR